MAEENNGSNFGSGEWYYSGNTSVSDVARGAAAPVTTAPIAPARTSAAEPVIQVNTRPQTPVHSDSVPAQHGKPPTADSRQQTQIQPHDSGRTYFSNLSLPITAEDKPLFDSFAQVLAKHGVAPAVGPDIFRWYTEFTQKAEAAERRALQQTRLQSEQQLRSAWGANFAANVARAERLIDDNAPDTETADNIFNAVLPNGEMLGDNYGALCWLHRLAVNTGSRNADIANGYGPGAVNVSAIDKRLAEIKKHMAVDRSPYWKGPRGSDGKTDLEREYDDLIQRRDGG